MESNNVRKGGINVRKGGNNVRKGANNPLAFWSPGCCDVGRWGVIAGCLHCPPPATHKLPVDLFQASLRAVPRVHRVTSPLATHSYIHTQSGIHNCPPKTLQKSSNRSLRHARQEHVARTGWLSDSVAGQSEALNRDSLASCTVLVLPVFFCVYVFCILIIY